MLFLCLTLASVATATTYYVDSVAGYDNNAGTSQSTPWQNLTKVNTITFSPGDQILLKCGSVWNGQQLYPKGSGTSGSPILVDMYGTGSKPLINCANAFMGAVYLYNQQYWEISNLEVTNWTTGTPGEQNGVRVIADSGGTKSHIYLRNLDIHNVNGSLTLGRDNGKANGGILFDVLTTRGSYNDILIEGCYIHFVDRTGIKFWSNFSRYGGATWTPHTNVVIRNNTLNDIGGDGIVPCISDAPLVEYNVASYCNNRSTNPNVAMWVWDAEDALFQYNEAYLTQQTNDGQGYDIDDYQHRTVMQYNYSHDNVGGFMLVCNTRKAFNTDGIIRYNLSQNDHNKLFRWSGYNMLGFKVYNNVFYLPATNLTLILQHNGGSGADAQYLNNIFYNNNATATYNLEGAAGSGVLFNYNVFYGYHPAGTPANPGEPNDAHKIVDNPLGSFLPQLMVNPGSGGNGRNTVDGYKLCANSPAIDSGVTVPNNGGKDYWGNTVPTNGVTDRGAHEYQGGGGSPPVANFTGNPTSGTAPLTVMFTDSSTNSPTSWSWTFGDGGTSTAQNPSHIYAAGAFTVNLTATNQYGSDGETKTNYITAGSGGNPPVAQFVGNPTSGTAPLAVAFTDQSTNSPTSWSWTFGDGGTSTAQNPSHSYAAGTYTVSLTATNAYGSDGETKTNYITATSGGGGGDFTCVSATITTGTLKSGSHVDTHISDDVYMVVTAATTGGKKDTIIEYTFETGLTSVSSLSVTSESHVSYAAPPSGQRERIYVWNYTGNSYDLMGDNWVLTYDGANVATVTTPSAHLSAGGQVKVQIRTGDRASTVYDHSIDLVKITAQP